MMEEKLEKADPVERYEINALRGVIFTLLLSLVPPDTHRDRYASIKKVADLIGRETDSEQANRYLNEFLRMKDDFGKTMKAIAQS